MLSFMRISIECVLFGIKSVECYYEWIELYYDIIDVQEILIFSSLFENDFDLEILNMYKVLSI